MERVRTAIAGNVWIRAGILAVPLLVLTWYFGFTPSERADIGMKAAAWAGHYLVWPLGVGLILGGSAGWIKLNWRVFFWVALTAFTIMLALVVKFG